MNDNKQRHRRRNSRNTDMTVALNRKMFYGAIIVAVIAVVLNWLLGNGNKIFGFIGWLFSLLSPFIIGACIAFVVNVLLRLLEGLWKKIFSKSRSELNKRFKRPVCLILSFLIVIGLLFALVFMVLPEFKSTLRSFINGVPQYISNLDIWWHEIIVFAEKFGIILPEFSLNTDQIMEKIGSLVKNNDSVIVNTTLNITTSILSGVFNGVLAFAFSIYILAQKEKLGSGLKKLLNAFLPRKTATKIMEVAELSGQTFTNFVTGQLTEATIIGVLCFIGMLIFRMPYAGVISVLIGFTALIPVFGAFIGTAFGAFFILLVSPLKAFWFVVFIIVLQQFEGNLIYPKVVGKSVGLPGIWVLAAVTIGGSVFGVVGMLLAVPICAVLYCLLKKEVYERLKNKSTFE